LLVRCGAIDREAEMAANEIATRFERAGKELCAILNRCETLSSTSKKDLLSSEWEEFVIIYDPKTGEYKTRTACCPGAPVCC